MIRLVAIILFVISIIIGCSTGPNIAGTESGSQTSNGFTAVVMYPGGTPAAFTKIRVRERDYLADTANTVRKSLISKSDLFTDKMGRFTVNSLDTGEYIIEAFDTNGNAAAVPCRLPDDTMINLGTRTLSPMGTITVFTAAPYVNGLLRVHGLERCIRTSADGLTKISVPAGLPYTLNIVTADTSVDFKPIAQVQSSETLSVSIDLGVYKSDSIAIRVFLDSIGLDTVPVQSVATPDSESNRLRFINLSHRKLTEIPSAIGRLSFLWSIDVSNNPITSLPSTLKNIPQLSVLNFDSTDISILPAVVTECTSLQWLFIAATGIRDLPQEITQLSALHYLDMSDDSITVYPPVISSLLSLKTISLARNRLKVLPKEIGNLKLLEYLHLDDNQLDSLPGSLTSLTHLTTLYAYRNNLSAVPDSIGKMTELTLLDVQSNKLTSLPSSIAQCTHLTYIHLWGNLLTTLPDEIISLAPIKGLFLGNNHLCNLPDSLSAWADKYGEMSWRSKQICP